MLGLGIAFVHQQSHGPDAFLPGFVDGGFEQRCGYALMPVALLYRQTVYIELAALGLVVHIAEVPVQRVFRRFDEGLPQGMQVFAVVAHANALHSPFSPRATSVFR